MTTLATVLTGPQSVITTAISPSMGSINRYNASGGALAVVLPALSPLNVGASCIVEKDTLDATANAIVFTTFSGDLFDDLTTSVAISQTGGKRNLQVISVGGTKYWKLTSGYNTAGILLSAAQGLLSPTFGGIAPVTQAAEVLPGSVKLRALQLLEVNPAFSLEIPATSSLEITAYLDHSALNVNLAPGKSFTVNNSLTLAGTDGTTFTFPNISDTVVTLAGSQALTNKNLTGAGNTFPTFNQNTTGTAAGLSSTLVVSSGGTGATTLTGLVVGNGTSPMTAVAAPAGTVVGTSDTQTLTNKTLTDPVLTACTATVPSMTVNSGTVLTTAAAGAVEFDGVVPYFTPSASTRHVLNGEQFCTIISNFPLANVTTAQAIFNSTANGAVTLQPGTYFFECFFSMFNMSATSSSFGFGFGGTANITSQQWWAEANKVAALGTPATPVSSVYTAFVAGTTTAGIAPANTNTTGYVMARGKIRIHASGTLIPQTQMGVATGPKINPDSYFRIWPVGAEGVLSVGNWS